MFGASIRALPAPAPGAAPHEMAEHKGRGHPDTLCDALAENLSIALSRFYFERFGAILHHNVDKALLLGGAARPAFGGGELVEPIEITLAGRATRRFRGVAVPVEELAVEASRDWLARHVRNLDPARDVRIVPRIRETSQDLAALFLRHGEGGVALANDTSFGAGFARSTASSARCSRSGGGSQPQTRTPLSPKSATTSRFSARAAASASS